MEGNAAPQASTPAQGGNAQAQASQPQQKLPPGSPGRADVPRGEVKTNVAANPNQPQAKQAGPTRADGKPIQGQAPANDNAANENQEAEEKVFELKGRKYTEAQLLSELGRSRQSAKLLTEVEKRRQEADRKLSEFNQHFNRYVEDPNEFFKEAKFTPEQKREWLAKNYYEGFLKEQVERENLTPEMARIRELEHEVNNYKTEKQREQEAVENQRRQAIIAQHIQRLEGEAMELAKSEHVAAFPGVAYAAAETMEQYQQQGINISLAEAVAIVKQKVNTVSGHYLASAEAEDLVGMYGDEVITALSKKLFAYMRAKRMQGVNAQPEVVRKPFIARHNQPEQRSEKPLTSADAQRIIDQRLGRK